MSTDEGIGSGGSRGEPWKLTPCPKCNRIGRDEVYGLRCGNTDCENYMGSPYVFAPGEGGDVLPICPECGDTGIDHCVHHDDGTAKNVYCYCPRGVAREREDREGGVQPEGLLCDE